MSSEVQICNLLYRYAEMIDGGRLEEIGELFRHARFFVGAPDGASLDADAMMTAMRSTVILHPDGTPGTKHVITNPIVDEDAGRASCRSYYTVFQQTPTLPLQPVIAGRYHDRFERVNGEWRFAARDYTLVDMVGDVSQHVRYPVPSQERR
jgi:3-phenylpropionate/cinnamic acid dioxygenase small subunit